MGAFLLHIILKIARYQEDCRDEKQKLKSFELIDTPSGERMRVF
jgi:hypothetical protein